MVLFSFPIGWHTFLNTFLDPQNETIDYSPWGVKEPKQCHSISVYLLQCHVHLHMYIYSVSETSIPLTPSHPHTLPPSPVHYSLRPPEPMVRLMPRPPATGHAPHQGHNPHRAQPPPPHTSPSSLTTPLPTSTRSRWVWLVC